MPGQDTIQIGSRVYLRNAIAGEPGCVRRIEGNYAHIEWIDIPEIGRLMKHRLDSLMVDELFHVEQLRLDFGELAA